jgi:hypothetical protein
MALARHRSRGMPAASIPLVCDVCREAPVTTLVVGFIFACEPCSARISTRSGLKVKRARFGREFLLRT